MLLLFLRIAYWLGLIGLTGLQITALLGAQIYAFDAINHFQPFLFLTGLLALGLGLALYGSRLLKSASILLVLFTLGVSSVMIGPEIWMALTQNTTHSLPSSKAKIGTTALKVISFNLWAGNWKQDEVLAFLYAEDPDLIVVQELASGNRRLIEDLRTRYPHQLHCANRAHCKLGIFSKYRLSAPQIEPFAFRKGPRPRFRDRAFGETTIKNSGPIASARLALPDSNKPIHIVTAHLRWPLPGDRQRQQFFTLRQMLKTHPADRTLLAGDFNSTPWSFALKRFDRQIEMTRHTRAFLSFPTPHFYHDIGKLPGPAFLPIDQLYTGRDFQLQSIRRGPFVGSDHYPIIADFIVSG